MLRLNLLLFSVHIAYLVSVTNSFPKMVQNKAKGNYRIDENPNYQKQTFAEKALQDGNKSISHQKREYEYAHYNNAPSIYGQPPQSAQLPDNENPYMHYEGQVSQFQPAQIQGENYYAQQAVPYSNEENAYGQPYQPIQPQNNENAYLNYEHAPQPQSAQIQGENNYAQPAVPYSNEENAYGQPPQPVPIPDNENKYVNYEQIPQYQSAQMQSENNYLQQASPYSNQGNTYGQPAPLQDSENRYVDYEHIPQSQSVQVQSAPQAVPYGKEDGVYGQPQQPAQYQYDENKYISQDHQSQYAHQQAYENNYASQGKEPALVPQQLPSASHDSANQQGYALETYPTFERPSEMQYPPYHEQYVQPTHPPFIQSIASQSGEMGNQGIDIYAPHTYPNYIPPLEASSFQQQEQYVQPADSSVVQPQQILYEKPPPGGHVYAPPAYPSYIQPIPTQYAPIYNPDQYQLPAQHSVMQPVPMQLPEHQNLGHQYAVYSAFTQPVPPQYAPNHDVQSVELSEVSQVIPESSTEIRNVDDYHGNPTTTESQTLTNETSADDESDANDTYESENNYDYDSEDDDDYGPYEDDYKNDDDYGKDDDSESKKRAIVIEKIDKNPLKQINNYKKLFFPKTFHGKRIIHPRPCKLKKTPSVKSRNV